jgi:hypothetical protein
VFFIPKQRFCKAVLRLLLDDILYRQFQLPVKEEEVSVQDHRLNEVSMKFHHREDSISASSTFIAIGLKAFAHFSPNHLSHLESFNGISSV